MKGMLARVSIIGLVVLSAIMVGCAAPQPTAVPPPAAAAVTTTPLATLPSMQRGITTETPGAAPAATATTAGQVKKGGILRVITKATPPQFGWTPTFAAGEATGANPSVEGLIAFDKTGSPLPKLATSWKFSEDGKSITFQLRKGVKFQDGTDFNAQAVKYNYDLVLKLRKGELPGVKSTDVLDDYTFRMNLDYFSNNLWDRMGTRGLISSPTHLAKGEDAVKFYPLGTGPFKFVEWKRDAYIKYVRNENYWVPGQPYLDGLEILFIADAMTAQAALLAGEADVYVNPDYKVAYDLKAKGYKIPAAPGFLMGLAPDTKNPNSVFKDKRVREAVEYAIDREALTGTLGYGALLARYQFMAPGFLGYVEGLGRKYDPAKAKQLLKDAGYPNGFKTNLIADAEYVSRDMMSAIQAYLKEVGIDVSIDYADAARYADWRRASGWKDGLIFMRNAGFPWPPNLASFIFDAARNDYASMKRPDGLQQTLDSLMSAQTIEPQTQYAKQLTQAVYDDVTYINLYFQYSQVIEAPYVIDCGRMESTTGEWTPEKCWVDK